MTGEDDLFSEDEKFAYKDSLRAKSVPELEELFEDLSDILSDDHFDSRERARAVAQMRLVSNELELRKLERRI